MVDWTRKADLEMLSDAMKNARTTNERERFEKMAYQMIHASAPIQSLREELVKAVSIGDKDRIGKIQRHIHAVRMEETNGHSFGNVKAEGVDRYE